MTYERGQTAEWGQDLMNFSGPLLIRTYSFKQCTLLIIQPVFIHHIDNEIRKNTIPHENLLIQIVKSLSKRDISP